MLGNQSFFFGSIRKAVTAFGSLFSDIHIIRVDASGAPAGTIKVPLSYGPKEKWYVKNTQNPVPGVDDQVEMVLPRMSYELDTYLFDPERHLGAINRNVKSIPNNNLALNSQLNPVPYNLGFSLNIMTKNMVDGLMIIEQIIPFFTPDYTFRTIDIPELGLQKDLSIVLNAITQEDTWDTQFNERRFLGWSMSFTAKAHIYPPLQQLALIQQAQVNLHADPTPGSTPDSAVLNVINPLNATGNSDFTVTTLVKSRFIQIIITPGTQNVAAGSTLQLQAQVLNFHSDSTITWALNPNIGTISSNGLYTAPAHGSISIPTQVHIIATSHEDTFQYAQATITVTP